MTWNIKSKVYDRFGEVKLWYEGWISLKVHVLAKSLSVHSWCLYFAFPVLFCGCSNVAWFFYSTIKCIQWFGFCQHFHHLLFIQTNWKQIPRQVGRHLKAEQVNVLLHRFLHFVNWQQQQIILEQNAFWEKEVLVECIKGVWRVQIRLVVKWKTWN